MFEFSFDLGPLHLRFVLADTPAEPDYEDEDEDHPRDVDMAPAHTERTPFVEPAELTYTHEDRRTGFTAPQART